MTDTPTLRRALWLAIASLFVASVLAGAVVGAGDDGSSSVVAGSPTSTTLPVTSSTVAGSLAAPTSDGSAAPSAEPAGTPTPSTVGATSSRGASAAAPPTTTAATAAAPGAAPSAPVPAGFADLGPAADGGAVAVPAAGTYSYATKSQDSTGEGSITIEDKGDAGNGARNLVMSLRGLGAGGFDSVNDVTWGPSAVTIRKSAFTFGAQSATCDWEPDYVELKLPLAKGASWQAASSCTVGAAIVKRSTTSTVSDARRVRVAGQEIDVWLITGTERIEFNGQVEEAKVTTWFSGKHGMIVKSVAESSRGTGEYEITRLTPQ